MSFDRAVAKISHPAASPQKSRHANKKRFEHVPAPDGGYLGRIILDSVRRAHFSLLCQPTHLDMTSVEVSGTRVKGRGTPFSFFFCSRVIGEVVVVIQRRIPDSVPALVSSSAPPSQGGVCLSRVEPSEERVGRTSLRSAFG